VRAPDASEPLGLWTGAPRPLAGHGDLGALAFEFASRGDRVPGRLLLPPAGRGPFPLVLLAHGANGAKDAPYMDRVATPWARGGAAVASIDFPLHGERASAKLAGLLRAGLGVAPGRGEAAAAVAHEFGRQAVHDLRRCLDALGRLDAIDARRVAFAGLSLGAILGASFCALDPRPRAAVLALGGGGFGPAEFDPVGCVGRIAPRPVLFVNATRDETVPREAAERLHAAAGAPSQVCWFESGHTDLPGRAFKAIWGFLRPHLGLGA
jgi:dienelactone hydrolase